MSLPEAFRAPSKISLASPQVVALLLILPWLPIAALTGMAFDTPSATKSLSVWAVVGPIWLYPLVCVTCIVLAWIGYSRQRYGYAQILSWFPLIYVALMLTIFPSAVKFFSQPHYSKSEIAEAKAAFEEKCKDAKEIIYSKPTDQIEGILIATSLPNSYGQISNSKYGSMGPGFNGYGVVNSGYLRFYEQPANSSQKKEGATTSYKSYEFQDIAGKLTDAARSKYAVKFLIDVTEKEKALGLHGGSIEIVRIDTNATVARTTFFANHLHSWFCGHAPDNGHFDTFFFLKRALDLHAIYQSAYAKPTNN